MTRTLIGVSLLFALAAPLRAAEIRLGPETALTPVGLLGPAASAQNAPAVASNGDDFLGVWQDIP